MKRTFALLILLTLLTAALLLTACQNGETPSENAPAADDTAVEDAGDTGDAADAAAETEKPSFDLEEGLWYDNEPINFLVRKDGWDTIDIFAENSNAETINDAIYERNLLIEETYGVSIRQDWVTCESTYDSLYRSVSSGDGAYDAVDINGMHSFTGAQNGLLQDLTTLPRLELNKPWWDASAQEDLTIGGKLFYTMSDINLMSYKATWVTMFNKQILDNLGYEDNYLYDLVRDGKWTLDAYYDIVKGYAADLNNDGIMNSLDRYGTAMQTDGPESMLFCAGFRFIDKGEDGFEAHALTDRDQTVFEKVSRICGRTNGYNSHDDMQNESLASARENGRDMFIENRAIFFLEPVDTAGEFRDMDADFGIVPFPKADETQECYYSYADHWAGSFISVPITNDQRLDMTCAVLDAMAYYSHEMVTPAYFDLVVDGKVMRDNESYEMLTDYIMTNRIYDLEIATNYFGLSGQVLNIIKTGGGALASTFARSARTIETALDPINTSFGE